MAGLATAALATVAACAGAADERDYEVIELEPDQRLTVSVESGETLENVLYDQTAPNAQVVIAAHGTDWTVRNVGIRGQHNGRGAHFGVSDRGNGTSRIENVYMGDGAIDEHRAGLGIWVAPHHNGHLDIERVNIQEMGDNSFYCSAPGGSGTVDIRNCYSANSWVAHYRLARGTVENCVAVNDERHRDGRGIWAWAPGPVEVNDCQLVMNGRHYAFDVGANNRASRVVVTDTQYDDGFNGGTTVNGDLELVDGNGTDPEDVVPEGCPTSPEAAAGGFDEDAAEADGQAAVDGDTDEGDDDGDRDHLLYVDGAGNRVDYEIRVSGGPIEPSTADGASINDNLVLAEDGTEATATVYGGADAWAFDGELETLWATDDAPTFLLDGKEVTPETGQHLLFVRGVPGTPTDYEFSVDGGPIEPSDHGGASINDNATIDEDGTVASKRVWGHLDAWTFRGELLELHADGPAGFELDGDVVEPDSLE